MPRASGSLVRAETALLRFGLAYPEAHEEFPWDERVLKVRAKIFVMLGFIDERLRIGVKLPDSSGAALGLPFAQPSGYNLGKAGWVTATFAPGETPPLDLLRAWIDESYRAVAPKKLVALLTTEETVESSRRSSTRRRSPPSTMR